MTKRFQSKPVEYTYHDEVDNNNIQCENCGKWNDIDDSIECTRADIVERYQFTCGYCKYQYKA